jgi:hypothetical protein
MSEVDGSVALETSGSEQAEVSELKSISSQTSYDAFLVAAKALEPGVIEECCADVVLTYHNVVRGVETVLGSGLVIVGKLPNVNIQELSMLPRLAQGLAFATLQVQRELRNAPFGKLFERAQGLRRKLRKAADALAEAHLLSDADRDEVRLRGQREVLEDCLALVALFRRNEAGIAGRSPVSASDLREVEQVVQKLRVLLGQQGDGSDQGAPFIVRAAEMRDRFWTLLNQRHEVLWRCGAWLYGRAVDEYVPPLPVRQALVRKPPGAPFERGAPQAVREQQRSVLPPPPLLPGSAPLPVPARTPLGDLERKTKFLVRFGVIPPQR